MKLRFFNLYLFLKMRIFLSLILCVFIPSQCADSDEEESRLIKPDQIISLIHSSDLNQYTLTCTDSELIATDAISNHVYIFDYNTLEVVESFGRNGSGPGEFNGALYSVADDKSVYVYDSGNQRINVFNSDDWSYQSVISVGRNVSRFVVSSEYIYLSSPFTRTETPFMKVNMLLLDREVKSISVDNGDNTLFGITENEEGASEIVVFELAET